MNIKTFCEHEDRRQWVPAGPIREQELGIKARMFECGSCGELFDVHYRDGDEPWKVVEL